MITDKDREDARLLKLNLFDITREISAVDYLTQEISRIRAEFADQARK